MSVTRAPRAPRAPRTTTGSTTSPAIAYDLVRFVLAEKLASYISGCNAMEETVFQNPHPDAEMTFLAKQRGTHDSYEFVQKVKQVGELLIQNAVMPDNLDAWLTYICTNEERFKNAINCLKGGLTVESAREGFVRYHNAEIAKFLQAANDATTSIALQLTASDLD